MTGTTRTDDAYAALYREHNARLVAYARSLTGNPAVAEDLAAEAHFRVWRRMNAGHPVQNPSAYLTTTVRNLAAGLGRAQRETAGDIADLPDAPERAEPLAADPERRASHVDLISRLLKELPERWAKALWYAEVEDLPMEEVGARIGASAATAAVVLTRARERLRQAFLQSQPGRPADEACEPYWKQMSAVVRGTASPRRSKSVTEHCDGCADCRARMLALAEANTRLPLLLGPALLGVMLGGGAWFLPAVAGAPAAAGKVGAATRLHGRHARHRPSPAKAAVYGSVAAVGIAVAVATIALGSTPPSHPTAAPGLQPAAHPTIAASQAAAVSNPTSAVTTAAAATTAPRTTSPTSAASAASAANPTRQTPAAANTSPASTQAAAAAATTTRAAPTSSTATTLNAVNSPSTPGATTAAPTSAPTPTPTPSPAASSPTQNTPTGSSPTSSPTPSPSCVLDLLGLCVIP